MKKLLKMVFSFIFTILMLSSFSIISVSASELEDSSDEDISLLYTEEEMRQYEEEAYQKIQENIDNIHDEIEKYQNSHPQPRGYSYDGFYYLDGDIIITHSTSSSGLIGHAGIVVGDKVLEIHPSYNNGVPKAISFSTWFNRYPTAMVVRYDGDREIPVDAAWYGKTFYIDGEGKDNKYSLASVITDKEKDYCSSLVWKCFYYGADFEFEIFRDSTSGGRWGRPSMIAPYDFITYRDHNGFVAVHSVDW